MYRFLNSCARVGILKQWFPTYFLPVPHIITYKVLIAPHVVA